MRNSAEVASTLALRNSAPFPGLRSFSFEDHPYFFGREDQTFALCSLLLRNHFVAVVGSSGSGKSSIVRAGLLPQLDSENHRGSGRDWTWITMRPGRNPIGNLAKALVEAGSESSRDARRNRVEAILRSSSHGISQATAPAGLDSESQIVLVVDQFEELFRFLSAGPRQLDRAESIQRRDTTTEFVELLLAATRRHDSRFRVVITMRSDFIGECALFQGLPEAVSAAQFLVPSLSKDQRREAIREPIAKAGGTIDPELVERLVEDSGHEADQLPILQHCLARLWARAESVDDLQNEFAVEVKFQTSPPRSRRLTVRSYEEIGGLAGALSGHAEEILANLPGLVLTVEQIFRALGEIDTDGRAIRRARPLIQLVEEAAIDQKVDRESICNVLDRFRSDDCSFVLPPLSVTLSNETVIDVGHEALLRRWVRVSGEPGATGERGEKRDIGWLRREKRDGEAYQFLRSCVDPETPNDSQLPANQVQRYWAWWQVRRPSRAWTMRYGGMFDEVERLVTDSYRASRRSRWSRRLAYMAGATVPLVLLVGFLYLKDQERLAQDTYRTAINSAETFSRKLLDNFNSGQLKTSGALELQEVASSIYPTVKLRETSKTAALRTQWLLTDSDLDFALGNREELRRQAEEAEYLARKYAKLFPQDRNWQHLLYGSLFRLGDIDRDELKSGSAEARYLESEKIARQLYPNDAALLHDDAELAERRFDLAFAINKVGETLQERGETAAAIERYQESLAIAVDNESAPRMEHKLQSATTRVKIASALMDLKHSNIPGALKNYSDAIEREQAIFKGATYDHIVRSNLATAYQGRAQAFQQVGEFDDATRDFTDAIGLLSGLSADDPENLSFLERLAQLRSVFGNALERLAASQKGSLERAIEQYRFEAMTLARLTQLAPRNGAWQLALRASQERLDRILKMHSSQSR